MIIRDNISKKKLLPDSIVVQIVVLIGARQVGKTSIMKSCKWDRKNLFLNGQDPEIAELFQRFSDIEQYLKSVPG